MDGSAFSPDILSLIDERERLEALSTISEVVLERDQIGEEWVLSVSPRERFPQFESFKRFNVPGTQINNAIREAWGSVARAAQLENQQTLENIILQLEPTIPTEKRDEPKLSSWLPTATEGKWESTQNYGIWDIEPTTITKTKRFAYLQQVPGGYTLSLPDNREVTVSQKTQSKTGFRIPENRSEMLRMKEERRRNREAGKPTDFNNTLTSVEHLHNELQDFFGRVAEGKELEQLVDEYEDRKIPKRIGLAIGMVLGLALTAVLLSKDNPEAGGSFILICTGIWILKRLVMFVYSRATSYHR